MIIVYITFFYLLSDSYTNTILNIYFIGLFYALPDIGTRYICASLCIVMLNSTSQLPYFAVFFLVNIVLFTLRNCIYRNETCSNPKCWILCLFDFVSRTNPRERASEDGAEQAAFLCFHIYLCWRVAASHYGRRKSRRLTMAEGKVDKDSTGEVLDKVQLRDDLTGKVIKDNDHDRIAAIKLLLVGWFSWFNRGSFIWILSVVFL